MIENKTKVNFNFEVNIELRVPGTGKVYMIDRMTSDWAQAHPLNVDQLIEDVYLEFAGTEYEESREKLRKVWMDMLSVKNPQGDASIYPNNNGAHRPASVKVWLTAGDYWRRGFRYGDVLPERCPSHTITRLPDGGWISLFPKDLHLLNEGTTGVQAEEHLSNQPEQLDLFAQMKAEMQALRSQNEELRVKNEELKLRPRRARRQKVDVMQLYGSPAITVDHSQDDDHAERNKKIFAAVATAVVFVILLNTVGLFGIAALGLLAGGILK